MSNENINLFVIVFSVHFGVVLAIAHFYGRKKKVGFYWSLFFGIFFSWLILLFILMNSGNYDEKLRPSPIKKQVGWALLLLGILSSIVGFIKIESLFLGIGLVGSGYYLINTSKGSKMDSNKSTNCKYCNLEVVLEYNELINKRFVCPECEKVNDLKDDIETITDYAKEYSSRGRLYEEVGNYEEAVKEYSKSIEINPNYADAYYNRGFTDFYLKNYEESIKDWTRAIELNPDYESELSLNLKEAKEKLR